MKPWKCNECGKFIRSGSNKCSCGYEKSNNIKEDDRMNNSSTNNGNRFFINDTILMNSFTIGYLKMAYIPLSEMKIDFEYQRVATKKVDKITNEWDINKCDPISVSYRNGKFYITDGQHRFLSAVRKGETHLPAIIRTGLTQKEEAKIFVSQNDNVSRLTPYDTFKGNLLLEDHIDCTIQNLCMKYNIIISQYQTKGAKGVLGSLTEARSIVKSNGGSCLEWIFKIIKACGWSNESGGYSSYIMRTLRTCYINNINDLEITGKYACSILEKTTPSYFKAEAVLEYVERDVTSACGMLLMKKIQSLYLADNKLKTLNKEEFINAFRKSAAN